MAMLTFCVPTYNRADVLEASLERLVPLAQRYRIPICISDNCSTDRTPEVVAAAASRYDKVVYMRNERNVGPDLNFANVLKMSSTAYTWLLSDDDYLTDTALESVLNLTAARAYDLILLNGGAKAGDGRVRDQTSRDLRDAVTFLVEFGWHATWISGLVFGRRLLDSMCLERHDNTSFAHFIAMFEGLSTLDEPLMHWHAPSSFYPSPLATFSSESQVLKIFVDRWTRAVNALPEFYPPEAKRACILAHGQRTGLLTAVGLLNLRAKGVITLPLVLRHRRKLALCSPCFWPTIVAISAIPRAPLAAARAMAVRRRDAHAEVEAANG
jgi:hypothetical protein